MPDDRRRLPRGTLPLAALSLALGCGSVGTRTVVPDQFDYGRAIQIASSEQLLLNMVRLRYAEPPVFLAVSSVISQYRFSTSLSLGATANGSVADDNTANVGLGGSWADRPTISYTPISGREFATILLEPLSIESLFQLLQSGAAPDLVVRVTLVSINGLRNEIARPSQRRRADPELRELMELWARLRDEGGLSTYQEDRDGKPHTLLALPLGVAPGLRTDQQRLRELLRLDPGIEEFRLVPGRLARAPDEIAVVTGSLRDILVNMAWRFDVPSEHVEEGRTDAGFESDAPPPIRVQHSRRRPRDAFVAVERRGTWFYIDDRDRASKRSFSFVHTLLDLAQGAAPARGPVLTID